MLASRLLVDVLELLTLYREIRLASDCAVALEPFRYPFLLSEEMRESAVAHMIFPLSDTTSEGWKEVSREAVSVASRGADLSCTDEAVTRAVQSAVLVKNRWRTEGGQKENNCK